MSVSLEITVDDVSSRELLAHLQIGPKELLAINERMAARADALTRDYLTAIAESRHTTAEELGARPTGFWADAAENVQSSADEDAATVSIFSPGIGRVDHDVEIFPTDGRQYLTIPVAAMAYGVRAAELSREITLFAMRTRGVPVLATRAPGQKIATIMYLLVPSVMLPQDRTLLPSDAAYIAAGKAGIRDWVNKREAA